MAEEQQSPAQRLLGDFAPKMVQLTDDVLFGDVWKRPGLSPRDRSLVTVAVLAATYRPDQLASHLRLALANGLTQDELVEALTHLAFYAGWPSGMAALTQLKTITADAGVLPPPGSLGASWRSPRPAGPLWHRGGRHPHAAERNRHHRLAPRPGRDLADRD
jgi:4-carboxymuconolactone decarboxylase